ncbi:hypothetical protein [Gordonia sputi]|uniref:hypothetical protein n=1 Tax=Gordonia sputi TaxID=36823 RepID=UPI0028AF1497|nr:hypothetical protein [Gordonia sputi]
MSGKEMGEREGRRRAELVRSGTSRPTEASKLHDGLHHRSPRLPARRVRPDPTQRREDSSIQRQRALRRGQPRPADQTRTGRIRASHNRIRRHTGAQALHRLTSIAVVTSELSADTPHVLSHVSAATMLGLRMLKPNLSHVHMTTGRASGGSVRSLRHLHGVPLSDDEITEVDGIRVTSIERTAVDVASSGDFAQAMTVLEAALAAGADRAKMSEILGFRRRRGAQHARRALPLASGLSQSVGESWSSAQMYEADLPVPRQQHRFICPSGTYETDFDWDGKLIGEFDGLAKYGRLLREGESPKDAVVREKLREDELRGLDTMVLRWVWATLERRQLAGLLRPWLVTFEIIPADHGSRSRVYFPLIESNKREGNG